MIDVHVLVNYLTSSGCVAVVGDDNQQQVLDDVFLTNCEKYLDPAVRLVLWQQSYTQYSTLLAPARQRCPARGKLSKRQVRNF